MYTNLQDWREARLKNYADKLQLSQKKALKLLMRITSVQELTREFDRICDSPYRSNKEPGLSFKERKEKTAAMFAPPKRKPIQLKLFK